MRSAESGCVWGNALIYCWLFLTLLLSHRIIEYAGVVGTMFVEAEGLRAPWGSCSLHFAAQVTTFFESKAAHWGNMGPSTPLAALRLMELPCQQDPGCTSRSPWLPSFLPFSRGHV